MMVLTLMMQVWTLCILGNPQVLTFVDIRMIQGGLTRTQWSIFMKEVYRVLNPGSSWVQCIEYHPRHLCNDGSVPKDAAIFKVFQLHLL